MPPIALIKTRLRVVALNGFTPRRTFLGNVFSNIKSSLTQGFKDKKLDKQREVTLWQLNHVASLPSYTMKDHMEMLVTMTEKAGLNNLMTNLVTTVSKDQKAALDEQVRDMKGGGHLCVALHRTV